MPGRIPVAFTTTVSTIFIGIKIFYFFDKDKGSIQQVKFCNFYENKYEIYYFLIKFSFYNLFILSYYKRIFYDFRLIFVLEN